jgi:RNA polymerase sigma-70 factor (ECF subfamily)
VAQEPEAREGESPEVLALVRAARAGDAGAFRQLVEAYMRPIYALGRRLLSDHDDADDLAQETFVRAYQALGRYDERYGFHAWLRTIATRLALNEIAKRRRRRTEGGELFEAAAETRAEAAPGPDAELEAGEMRERLQAALASLPEEFRTALVLRTHEGLSYEEIAHTLGVPIGTVMSRIHRARCLLRERLEGQAFAAKPRKGAR